MAISPEADETALSDILKAMAHPKRLRVLHLLQSGGRDYSELLEALSLGKTALANHLSILAEAGLILREKRGSYRLTEDGKDFYASANSAFSESRMRRQVSQQRRAAQYARRGGRKMKRIQKLRYQPRWVSHLGAIEGCLRYAGHKISTNWLYGGTGHAFVLSIAPGVCPSGPTAWRTMMLFQLAPNLGYSVQGVFASKDQSDFHVKQKEAWNHIRKSLDNDIPCYGWELESPEFYVVQGYDEIGYWYSGPESVEGKGPRPWNEVGTSDIGILEMYSVHPAKEAAPEKVLSDAIEKVLYMAENPADVVFEQNRAGMSAYDLWISEVKSGSALPFGMSYNAAVWAECRSYAVGFLKEAEKKLDREHRDLIREARTNYDSVAKALRDMTKLYPFPQPMEKKTIGVNTESEEAQVLLGNARTFEARGLETLRLLLNNLRLPS